jgi:hypothetical protein
MFAARPEIGLMITALVAIFCGGSRALPRQEERCQRLLGRAATDRWWGSLAALSGSWSIWVTDPAE